MPNTITIAFRLFGNAGEWRSDETIKKQGAHNIRFDCEIAWIRSDTAEGPKVLPLYKNQQHLAHLLANALLRASYKKAPKLSRSHYLHEDKRIDPMVVRTFLDEHAPWLACNYRVDAGANQTVSIVGVGDVKATTTQGEELNDTWRKAFLSRDVPNVIDHLTQTLHLNRHSNMLSYHFEETSDFIFPFAETEFRAVYLASDMQPTEYHPHFYVKPPHLAGAKYTQTWKARVRIDTRVFALHPEVTRTSDAGGRIKSARVRFIPNNAETDVEDMWDRKLEATFSYGSHCSCESHGNWYFESSVPFKAMTASVKCTGLLLDKDINQRGLHARFVEIEDVRAVCQSGTSEEVFQGGAYWMISWKHGESRLPNKQAPKSPRV